VGWRCHAVPSSRAATPSPRRYGGYEVTTEGDSFTVAFHDALDAVAWALHAHHALLGADWPEELLTHDKAAVVFASEEECSSPGSLLYRGLRIRVAINTGGLVRLHRWLTAGMPGKLFCA